MNRRGFLGLLGAAAVAPAIVRIESLMPLSQRRIVVPTLWGDGIHDDTMALQWRINQSILKGETLLLPAGIFMLSDSLVSRGAHIVGARDVFGNGTVLNGTKLTGDKAILEMSDGSSQIENMVFKGGPVGIRDTGFGGGWHNLRINSV